MIASLALLLLAPRALTLEEKAVRLEDLLTKVGEQTGQMLECVPDLADDRLVVQCSGVESDALLSRVADAVEGRWTEIEGGKRLVPDTARQKTRRDGELQERINMLQRGFDKIVLSDRYDANTVIDLYKKIDAIDPKLTQQAREARLNEFRYSHPTARFEVKMAKLLGAKELGAIDGEVVYSTHPTRFQRPLPAGADSIIRDFLKERVIVHQVRSDRKFGPEDVFLLGELAEDDNGFDTADYEAPAVSLIKVNSQKYGVSIKLQTYDSEGGEMYMQRLVTPVPQFEDIRETVFNPEMPTLTGPFNPSEDARSWLNLSYPANTGEKGLTPRVEGVLRGSGDDDFLSFGVSEMLLQAAEELDTNLLAVLDDRAAMILSQAGVPASLQQLMRSLLIQNGGSATVEDGWLTVVPHSLDTTRENRLARAELHALFNNVLEQRKPGELPVDQALVVIGQSPNVTFWGPYLRMAAKLTTSTWDVNSNGIYGDSWGLEFVSQLDPVLRRRLLQEGQVELSQESLPDEMLEKVYDLMQKQVSLSDKTHKFYEPRKMEEMRSPDIGYHGAADGIFREPTWTLAQPAASPLRVTILYARQDTFRQIGDGYGSEKITLYGVAEREFGVQLTKEMNAPGAPKHSLYAAEPLAGFFVTLSFGERFEHTQSTYLALRSGQAKAIGFGEFEGERKRAVDQMVEQMLKKYRDRRGGGGN